MSCLRPVNKPTPMLVQTTGAKLSSRSQTSKQAKTGIEIRGGTVGKEKKKEGKEKKAGKRVVGDNDANIALLFV